MDSLKLPFSFDSSKILDEINQFSKADYYDIYNPSVTLETLWSKSFIFPKGSPDEIPVFYPNEYLKKCPYLLSIFDKFECRVETFRLHSLDPGASIKPHHDSGYSFEHGKVRLHIPIKTNDKVEILLNGNSVKMKEGECWYCNFDKIHEVHNRSDTARVHLIIDCIVDDWLKGVFESATEYQFS